MRLNEMITLDELKKVMQEEYDTFQKNNEAGRKLIKEWHDLVDVRYAESIYQICGPQGAGQMFRMLCYIDQVLRRKSVQ